ncbi:MAG: hypothetical protein M5U34_16230 [Chloroflexi bacterium]|nr:hypothetical protein [Chloroflexota bacterium]
MCSSGANEWDNGWKKSYPASLWNHTCPFAYKSLPADLIVKEVDDNETLIIGDRTRVQVAAINHPGGCLGFRIENDGVVFAYCSDVSHDDDNLDAGVLNLVQGADLLVHDSHFASVDGKPAP